MGQEGLYVLILLGLLMVASERNKGDGTRCWPKSKEVTLGPHQCPAEFDGAGAKFCCQRCFGANCCQPRRARMNLHRGPREARLAEADQYYTTAPDLTTAPPTSPPLKDVDWFYIFFLSLMFTVIAIAISWHFCIMFWKSGWPIWKEDIEEETQARANDQSSRDLPLQPLRSDIVPDNPLRPCPALEEDQAPYSLVVSQGTYDLPAPHPGQPVVHSQGAHDFPHLYPVVAFPHSHSHRQDDTMAHQGQPCTGKL